MENEAVLRKVRPKSGLQICSLLTTSNSDNEEQLKMLHTETRQVRHGGSNVQVQRSTVVSSALGRLPYGSLGHIAPNKREHAGGQIRQSVSGLKFQTNQPQSRKHYQE